MHVLSKKIEKHPAATKQAATPAARTCGSIALLLILNACSGGLGGLLSPSNNGQAAGGVYRMQSNVQAAVCEGRADEAVALLTAEPIASQADKFFVALAVDESGHPVRARQLYVRLMQVGSQDQVVVKCGKTILAEGSVSTEAARRLSAVAQEMAALDANLRPSPALHAGLPSIAPVIGAGSRPANNAFAATGPIVMIQRPSSQSPFGRWFVHLSSYRSIENAQGNRSTLEKQFPKLSGLIDQWEVNVNGPAIRLGVRTDNRTEADALCQAVKSQGSYCAVLDSSK